MKRVHTIWRIGKLEQASRQNYSEQQYFQTKTRGNLHEGAIVCLEHERALIASYLLLKWNSADRGEMVATYNVNP